jgi:hypothetical protein
MPGILDYNKILSGFGPYSTESYRKMLLGRNLPPPVTDTLEQSGLVSKLEDIGKIINVPIMGVENENIPVHYNEEERLLPLSIRFRDTRNVNLNRYIPQDSEYNLFTIVIPENLGYPLPETGDDIVRQPYPTSFNSDRFSLVSKGSEKGTRNPFEIIDGWKTLNHNQESSLGLLAGQQLEKSVIDKIAQIEDEANPNTESTGFITPPTGDDGGVDDYIDRIRGNKSYFLSLPENAIGWQEYNTSSKNSNDLPNLGENEAGTLPTISTEKRVNTLLENTSLTQVSFLFNLLSQNKFVPAYEDRRLIGTDNEGTNSRYYVGNEGNTNRGSTITKRFTSEDFNEGENRQRTTIDENFFWHTGGEGNFNEKTLLYKTQKLVDEHEDDVFINQTKKYFKDKQLNKLVSRGNAISRFSLIEAEANGNYCRSWTVNDEYNYFKAIRNTGLFSSPDPTLPGFSVTNERASLSVLMPNGMPKVHPTKEDSNTTDKKYMFSLENLAWADNLADLPMNEIGPGDLLNGTKGRIMWFPPYELNFDENVSANWTQTDFLGRGEPVYTYNNTKRSGQLSFKLLVDHPKVMNGYRGKRTNTIEKFLAGCIGPTEFLEYLDKSSNISASSKAEVEKRLNGLKQQRVNSTNRQTHSGDVLFEENDSENFTIEDATAIQDLFSSLESTKNKVSITVNGYAIDGEENPFTLSQERAENVYNEIINLLGNPKEITRRVNGNGTTNTVAGDPNGRRVSYTIENDAINNEEVAPKKETDLDSFFPQAAKIIDSLIIDESSYFDFVDANYPNYFSTISEKIKYFQPGFHSTTPEGFNTRLTFLQQCLRQGPSIYDNRDTIQPQNLAFGRPPVCILRIGDFFHTKIVINSLNITYDGGGGYPKWDLNPEGIGVQPMIANVTMSIDLIGGHALNGPINRLQNALSFNYYANTEMYDKRADQIDKSTGELLDGIRLGQIKEEALQDVPDAEKGLKSESPVEQELDATNTGDNTQTESVSALDIFPANTSVASFGGGPTPKTGVSVNSEDEDGREVDVVINVEQKGGFKEVLNETQTEDTVYNLRQYVNEMAQNWNTIKNLKQENSNKEWENEQLQSDPTPNNLKTIKENKKTISSNNKTIAELESEPNKVQVVASYKDTKKGSKTQQEFTYGEDGLT